MRSRTRPSDGGTRSSAAGLRSRPSTNSKIGLLGGTLAPATLSKLRSAAAFLKDGSGETGFDGVLGEIGLGVEVEIAKIAGR